MDVTIKELTLEDFKKGVYQALTGKITYVAPFGMFGDDIVLSGFHGTIDDKWRRISLVSLRKYGYDVELLITSKDGRFLFYGQFDNRLGLDTISEKYFEIYNLVKPLITEELGSQEEIEIADNVKYSDGFEILNMAYKNMTIER